MTILRSSDVRSVVLLCFLWGIFFWRILTPIPEDQVSFKQGDFSGQFVAFGAYQYDRLSHGEIPLWNPYNNGGFPFIADTQAAVFYPPRWLTIAFARFAGGWSYHALELEAIFHVLLYSLLLYAFLRRLLWDFAGGLWGALTGAVIGAYGGFISGYPPLQLALLEAATWLPLAALGILEATRADRPGWRCMALAGLALGLSWLAGHPQTSWFATYFLVAWLGYRVYLKRYGWRVWIAMLVLFGFITTGVTAVTFLPGVEYLLDTARTGLGFDAKGNGFPIQDVVQWIFPATVSVFSPLYFSIAGLSLVAIAARYRWRESRFWLVTGLIALLLSFGANSAFYHALYNWLPGLSFFRGQERAALLVSFTLATLAAIGMAQLAAWPSEKNGRFLRRVSFLLLLLIGGLTALIVVGWLGGVGDSFGAIVGTAVFSTLIAAAVYGLFYWQTEQPSRWPLLAIVLLIVFDLFSTFLDSPSNYDPIPASQQLSMDAPPLIDAVLADVPEQPFRVDGFRGLRDNYGSLYGLMDIRGISPLFLDTAQHVIYRDYVNNPVAWEIFAVRYVFSERERFSALDTTVIATGADRDGIVYAHELLDPRPYAHLIYRADLVGSDDHALELLFDPRYPLRESIILQEEPTYLLPAIAPTEATVTITHYDPETLTVEVSTPENAILSLAHIDYPGWQATVNGQPVPILRAYGALTAISIPAGEHTIMLRYVPRSYRIGGILSLATWGGLIILALTGVFRRRETIGEL